MRHNLVNKLFYLLIIFMPFHTLLFDALIKNVFLAGNNILNLWRDVLIIFLLLVALVVNKGKLKIEKIGLPVVISILIILVCFILSTAPFGLKLNIVRIYVIPMLMVLIMLNYHCDKEEYDFITKILFYQGVFLAVFGYIQVFILKQQFLLALGYGSNGALHHSFYIGGWHGFQRLVATFASPNNCALYLVQLFVISFINRDELKQKIKWVDLGLGIILLGILGTFSRSSWIATFVFLVFYFIFIKKIKIDQVVIRYLLGLVMILILLLLVDIFVLDKRMINMVTSSIFGVVSGTDPSFLKHLEDLLVPIKILLAHPFGLGFAYNGPIALAYLSLEEVNLVESSIWLVAYDISIFGCLVYYYPYFKAFFAGFKSNDKLRQSAAYLVLVSLIVFVLLPLHENVEMTFLIFTMIGLASSSELEAEKKV